jgi:hypothetical protein
MAAREQTPIERCRKLQTALRLEADTWDPTWKQIDQNIAPGRYRRERTDTNDGKRKDSKIVNNKAGFALRTLRAGMMTGGTNPSRAWFRLATTDPDLNEFGPVKLWLDVVTRRLRERMLRSNFYNGLSVLYGDIGAFGHAAMALLEDPEDVIRTYTFPVGSYVLACSDRLVVDTFIRDSTMTARQLVMRFGQYKPSGSADWSRFSTHVKGLWDRGDYEKRVDVVHAVLPNPDADPRRLDAKFKPWASLYYEAKADDKAKPLRESGYDDFPIMSPRWDPVAEDVYSRGPGWETLGDTKALQILEKRKAQANELIVRPPMTAPVSLRSQKSTILPGDTTYVDVREGQQGFKPAYQITGVPMQFWLEDIARHEARIAHAFYEDLFLMLAMSDRREITAREIDERHEEKLLMLGPVLNRLDDELYDPSIDRTFNIMARRNEFPLPPPDLEGMPLHIEYISIMAQAQKLVSVGSVERLIGFVGQVAQAFPDAHVEDKLNLDNGIDEYHDMLGAPASLLRSDDEANDRRARRAEANERAQRSALAEQQAKTAKTLADTDTTGDNALMRVIQGGKAA